MKIKMLYALEDKKFEKIVNDFLTENKDNIEVVDIKWKYFVSHYAMIIYKEK